MDEKLKQAIIATGLTVIAFGGGYFVSDQTTPEPIIQEVPVFNWWGDEGKVIMDVYNAVLADKKANCANETDCVIEDGEPKVVFEGITQDEIPAKLNEMTNEYTITVKKK